MRHWGLSNETPLGVCEFVAACAAEGVPPPVSVRTFYSNPHPHRHRSPLTAHLSPFTLTLTLTFTLTLTLALALPLTRLTRRRH